MTPTPVGTDIIVIGGGVAGLAAARELARAGLRVRLLEARARLGGRIFTTRPAGWKQPVELGAEFIHVGNPELWKLVRSAKIQVRRLPDRHWLGQDGGFRAMPDLDERIARVTRLITPRRAGRQSFGAYFRRYPPRGGAEDWMLARSFVEGFEAAPQDRISARSLAGESMDEEHQYALPGGYDQVVAALARECEALGVELRTGTVVRAVRWRHGNVRVVTRGKRSERGRTFLARAAIVTLPIGVLQARTGLGAVRFEPALRQHQKWIDRLQMGKVVRVILRIAPAAWRRLAARVAPAARTRGGVGFIHTNVAGVPVWWALTDRPIVVGWAGGPAASALLKLSPAGRRQRAISSLAKVLGVTVGRVKAAVVDAEGWDWTNDPFTRGAYSFSVAGEDDTAKKLTAPVEDTLFFAGEALADGAEIGTVHGALATGIKTGRVAARIVHRHNRNVPATKSLSTTR